jgi:signal transduction histidine kinase
MADHWFILGRRVDERTVLTGLVAGFGAVMLLLGAAGWLAVREGRLIRRNAEELMREQVLVTRLLHEAQVEEDALALALHRLTRAVDPAARIGQLYELEKADQAIARLAAQASATAQALPWHRLARETRVFSEQVREAFAEEEGLSRERMEGLFSSHDVVVQLIHNLILESTDHLEHLDLRLAGHLRTLAGRSALLLGSALILSGVCAAGTIAYVRSSIRRIEEQADELNRVSWHMLQGQEVAARRFSHELHDELGQSLAAVRANLVARRCEDEEHRRADCLQLVDSAISNVRELSQLLRPVILDDFGLDAGLRWLTEGFAQRTRLQVDYQSDLHMRLHSDLETHLFRIGQEALTNIARHAGATRVSMHLHAGDGRVCLDIKDDGCGLPADAGSSRPGLGLTGMRARARQCGGTLEIRPVTPHGLALRVDVPLRGEEAEASD